MFFVVFFYLRDYFLIKYKRKKIKINYNNFFGTL
jgi:hypothetical protein